LLKGYRSIEDAQKNLLQKVFEMERKMNNPSVQNTASTIDLTTFKHTIEVLQENFNKLKQNVRTDNTEMDKYHAQNLTLYNDKLENVQNDLRIIKKQQLNMMLLSNPGYWSQILIYFLRIFYSILEEGGAGTGQQVPNQNNNVNRSKEMASSSLPVQHLLKRLDIVELIADDYLELHVEREVMKCQQKLINAAFNLEEKMTGYCYILQHYRVVNVSLMTAAFVKFTEALKSNKNSSQ